MRFETIGVGLVFRGACLTILSIVLGLQVALVDDHFILFRGLPNLLSAVQVGHLKGQDFLVFGQRGWNLFYPFAGG